MAVRNDAPRTHVSVSQIPSPEEMTVKPFAGPQTDTRGEPSALLSRRVHGNPALNAMMIPLPAKRPSIDRIGPGLYRETLANGETFTGPMQNGRRHGEGTLVRGDIQFEGQFVNGVMNGYFSIRAPGGLHVDGPFVNGVMEGHFSVQAPCDGVEFTADYVNGKRNGYLDMVHVLPEYADDEPPLPEGTTIDSVEVSSAMSSPMGTPEPERVESVFFVNSTPSPDAERRPRSLRDLIIADAEATEFPEPQNEYFKATVGFSIDLSPIREVPFDVQRKKAQHREARLLDQFNSEHGVATFSEAPRSLDASEKEQVRVNIDTTDTVLT